MSEREREREKERERERERNKEEKKEKKESIEWDKRKTVRKRMFFYELHFIMKFFFSIVSKASHPKFAILLVNLTFFFS